MLEQQLAKLEKTARLVAEMDVCHSQFADKNSQREELRAKYRELRDTGRFTPTPAHLAAVSVSGDDVQRDTTGADAGLGSRVSSGRWHKTADQCRSLISVLKERLAEHQDIIDANLAFGDLDGGLQSGEENLG